MEHIQNTDSISGQMTTEINVATAPQNPENAPAVTMEAGEVTCNKQVSVGKPSKKRPRAVENNSSAPDELANNQNEDQKDGKKTASLERSSGIEGAKHASARVNGQSAGSSHGKKPATYAGEQGNKKQGPRAKRAKSNAQPQSQTMPDNNGPDTSSTAEAPDPADIMSFSTTIFTIHISGSEVQFTAHESVLLGSPKLAEEVAKAKNKPRRTQQNVLHLSDHNPKTFEQMLQFMYKGDFNLIKENNRSKPARMKEFAELMSLSKFYSLPNLQKQVVTQVGRSRINTRIGAPEFFAWAEEMYCEELDHENGPFKAYFHRVAPRILKQAHPRYRETIIKAVEPNGGFWRELLRATMKALEIEPEPPVKASPDVKSELLAASNEYEANALVSAHEPTLLPQFTFH